MESWSACGQTGSWLYCALISEAMGGPQCAFPFTRLPAFMGIQVPAPEFGVGVGGPMAELWPQWVHAFALGLGVGGGHPFVGATHLAGVLLVPSDLHWTTAQQEAVAEAVVAHVRPGFDVEVSMLRLVVGLL